ncbi:response regulator transcription factor [Microbacteriaceae bacterium VKM Ac-2855]|nr:response regulator transcription factor [Microbacteriaceae bacterium VKM Ac-2855]
MTNAAAGGPELAPRIAVVIEDDADIRELIATVLSQSGFTVHCAETAGAGVELVREHAPQICTVDVGLPDFDGFEATRRIRLFTDCYVIMLTALSDEADTLYGLESGADDYIVKPFRPRELRARVSAMMRRPRSGAEVEGSSAATPAPPAPPVLPSPDDGVFRHNGLVLDPLTHSAQRDGEELELTPTEFQLVLALLEGRRRVRSKADLVRAVREDDWAESAFISEADERAVEVHIGNVRRKLGDSIRSPRWVETVRGIGYRLAPAAPESRD